MSAPFMRATSRRRASFQASRSRGSLLRQGGQPRLLAMKLAFGRFTALLPRVARDHGIRLLTVSPSDESLESVFSYLVAA